MPAAGQPKPLTQSPENQEVAEEKHQSVQKIEVPLDAPTRDFLTPPHEEIKERALEPARVLHLQNHARVHLLPNSWNTQKDSGRDLAQILLNRGDRLTKMHRGSNAKGQENGENLLGDVAEWKVGND